MDATLRHKRLLYKISRDYYLRGLTQNAIAERLGLSRIKVSRLLKQARREGVVTITLAAPSGVLADLEEALEKRYGLEEAVVVACEHVRNPALLAQELAPATAECLVRRLEGGETVGISWGTTLRAVVDALPDKEFQGLRIVQMTGGLGPEATREHSAELARRMAEKFRARLHLLSAPGIVSDRGSAEVLKKDRQIAETLRLAAGANVALVGVGVWSPDSFLARDAGLLTDDDTRQITSAGAVGDIGLRHIAGGGRPVASGLDGRVIGLTFEELKAIPCVIAAAGGENKLDAVRAALETGIPKVLVTDGGTARRLAREAAPNPSA